MANFKVPYEFIAGTKAKAEEVNSNFSAIKEELNKKLDILENGYITIKDAVSDNQPISKSQFDTLKNEINNTINEKIENKEFRKSFLFESGNINSEAQPDLLDIEDSSKVVFKIDDGVNYKPLKGILADSTGFTRKTLSDLSVGELPNGDYNLFVGKDGDCIPLANTIYKQKTVPICLSEVAFEQPILSSNGVLGGDKFAVYCNTSVTSYQNNYPAWHAFDGNSTTNCAMGVYNYDYIIIYNPIPIKLTSFSWSQARIDGEYCKLEVSNDNANWTTIKNETNITTSGTITWDFSNNTNAYKYFKFSGKSTTGGAFGAYEMRLEGTVTIGSNLTNALWLDTSIKPYVAKKYNGTSWERFDYVPLPQNITIKNGVITSVNQTGNYNDNGWDNYVTLPNFSKSTTLTKNIKFIAPANGWIYNGLNMIKPIFRNESYTPSIDDCIFYIMKGE